MSSKLIKDQECRAAFDAARADRFGVHRIDVVCEPDIFRAGYAAGMARQSSDQQRIETAADNCEVLRARLARYEDAEGNALANAVGEIPELRQVVTDALMGMIAAVTSSTPPANEPPPPFIQAAIDRAVDRIARLNSSPVRSAPSHGEQVRDGFLLARETVVELPDGSKELGYTPMPGLGVFVSNDEVFSAIRELGLPLGWVSVRVGQVIASAPSAGSQEQGE